MNQQQNIKTTFLEKIESLPKDKFVLPLHTEILVVSKYIIPINLGWHHWDSKKRKWVPSPIVEKEEKKVKK